MSAKPALGFAALTCSLLSFKKRTYPETQDGISWIHLLATALVFMFTIDRLTRGSRSQVLISLPLFAGLGSRTSSTTAPILFRVPLWFQNGVLLVHVGCIWLLVMAFHYIQLKHRKCDQIVENVLVLLQYETKTTRSSLVGQTFPGKPKCLKSIDMRHFQRQEGRGSEERHRAGGEEGGRHKYFWSKCPSLV